MTATMKTPTTPISDHDCAISTADDIHYRTSSQPPRTHIVLTLTHDHLNQISLSAFRPLFAHSRRSRETRGNSCTSTSPVALLISRLTVKPTPRLSQQPSRSPASAYPPQTIINPSKHQDQSYSVGSCKLAPPKRRENLEEARGGGPKYMASYGLLFFCIPRVRWGKADAWGWGRSGWWLWWWC